MTNKYGYIAAIMLLILQIPVTVQGDQPFMRNLPSPEDCLDCHQKIWDEENSKPIVHTPFQNKQCVYCHAADIPLKRDSGDGESPAEEIIDWTGKSQVPATSHWFEIPFKGKNTTMILEAIYGSRVRLYREIPIPPLEVLPEIEEVFSKDPPRIEDVKILAIEKGVFLTATISWRTDRPTTATISYGIEGLKQQTLNDETLQTEHQQTLSNLKDGQVYRFRITAEDSIGNTVKSEVYELNTANRFSDSERKASETCCLATPLGLETIFYRRDNRYLVHVTMAQPVRLFFKIEEPKTKIVEIEVDKTDGLIDGEPDDTKHIVVNEKSIIAMIICKNCHNKLTGHHPVNIYPKKDMTIPADYPTLDDGRISCITCHTPHASNLPFLLIKDRRQELCIGCHSKLVSDDGVRNLDKINKFSRNTMDRIEVPRP